MFFISVVYVLLYQFIQLSEDSFQYNQIQISHSEIKQSRNQNEKSFKIVAYEAQNEYLTSKIMLG
jgi:hypothetical protein